MRDQQQDAIREYTRTSRSPLNNNNQGYKNEEALPVFSTRPRAANIEAAQKRIELLTSNRTQTMTREKIRSPYDHQQQEREQNSLKARDKKNNGKEKKRPKQHISMRYRRGEEENIIMESGPILIKTKKDERDSLQNQQRYKNANIDQENPQTRPHTTVQRKKNKLLATYYTRELQKQIKILQTRHTTSKKNTKAPQQQQTQRINEKISNNQQQHTERKHMKTSLAIEHKSEIKKHYETYQVTSESVKK